MYKIPLTQGHEAIVDENMYEYLTCWDWYYSDGYAKRAEWNNGKPSTVRMHHFVVPFEKGMEVDHINGNKLDNRKENLRLVTRQQNSVNKGLQKNSTSGYKGVNKHQGKWRSYIFFNGKQKHLGVFTDKIGAATAYNKAATNLFGQYAILNPV